MENKELERLRAEVEWLRTQLRSLQRSFDGVRIAERERAAADKLRLSRESAHRVDAESRLLEEQLFSRGADGVEHLMMALGENDV